MIFLAIHVMKTQLCEQQGVQNYKIDSKNYRILCQKGPAGKLWLVILNRFDGSVDFHYGRTYRQYALFGIGTPETQFFLSLEFLHKITTKQQMQLYVSMAIGQDTGWANYSYFSVGDAASKYRLSVKGYNTSSTAGDSLSYNNGMKFSAPDQDNDVVNGKCSYAGMGGFWFKGCSLTSPLGSYTSRSPVFRIAWDTFRGYPNPLDKIKFMLLPKQYGSSHLCLLNSSTFIQCVSCNQPGAKTLSVNDKFCLPSCQNNFYEDNLMCSPCHENCATCSGPNSYDCNSCADGKKEDISSSKKNPKECVDSCPTGSYEIDDGTCFCHENCATCSGPNNYNCNSCASGKKEDSTSILKDPKHCVDQCPSGSSQNSDNVCAAMHQDNLVVTMIFMIGIPLIISLFWRVIKSSRIKKLKECNELRGLQQQQQEILSNENQKFSLIFYYYKMELNKSRCNEYFLCLLACSDLTFTGLNLDMHFLRQLVVILNMARSLIFFNLNLLIYNSYSSSLSILNILTSLVLVPLPFIYKCITPRFHEKRRLISQDLKNLPALKIQREEYTYLNLNRRVFRNLLVAVFLILSIALMFLAIVSDLPDLNWQIYVILIQYGSYLVWSIVWGLLCCLINKNNNAASISRIPDWRAEMVFQDLAMMSAPAEKIEGQSLKSVEENERF